MEHRWQIFCIPMPSSSQNRMLKTKFSLIFSENHAYYCGRISLEWRLAISPGSCTSIPNLWKKSRKYDRCELFFFEWSRGKTKIYLAWIVSTMYNIGRYGCWRVFLLCRPGTLVECMVGEAVLASWRWPLLAPAVLVVSSFILVASSFRLFARR